MDYIQLLAGICVFIAGAIFTVTCWGEVQEEKEQHGDLVNSFEPKRENRVFYAFLFLTLVGLIAFFTGAALIIDVTEVF